MEQKLTKTQIRTLTALAAQRNELQEIFKELVEAENEQVQMLVKYYGLPDGEYKVKQVGSDVILYTEN
jgi:hypothetical protein